MSNLNSQTQYFVRSVIVATTGQRQVGEHLKHAEFTTTCEELADNNIDIKAFDTSVLIRLVQTTDITCKSYTMSLFEVQRRSFTNSSGTYFDGLEPFTEYTLKIQSTPQTFAEKKFMTTVRSAPDVIKGIVISALTSSSVDLKWTKPKLHGIFKQYTIEYQHVSYTACQARSSQPSMKTSKIVTDTGTNLTDLKPYSTYEISVSASNTKFDGQPYFQQITTPASDTVDPNEIPKIFNITTDHVAANIELTAVNCESIRGPLTVKFTTKCTSEWCLVQHREPKTESRSLPTNLITLTNLIAFSNFDIELKFCRENGPCDFSEKKTFKTKPTVPGRVNDLLIYTKNETSISLRWQPPTPPRGILKEYRINYRYYKRILHNRQMEVQPVSCELWPEFVCLTLADLYPDTYYTLEVSARNEDPPDFGPLRSVGTTTKTEQSTAPYDLKINWTLENDLLLGWRHPNETNGDVQYFGIVISINERTPIRKTFNITDNMYNLTYSYQLNATEFTPTTRYQITIFAFNGKRGLEISEETTSPPEIPTLAKNPLLYPSNHNIVMALFFKNVLGRTDNYRIIILRSDAETNLDLYHELQNFNLRNLRVLIDCNFTNVYNPFLLIVGESQQLVECQDIDNFPLEAASSYNITIILMNVYHGKSRTKIYSTVIRTTDEICVTETNGEFKGAFIALLVLLLIIPAAAFCYVKRKGIQSTMQKLLGVPTIMDQGNLDQRTDQIHLLQMQSKAKKDNPPVEAHHENPNDFPELLSLIKNFNNDFKTALENGELKNQYENILESTVLTYESVMVDTLRSDYVDMNFNNGLQNKNAYIIINLPTMDEFNEFWKVVVDENVNHIVLFAHLYPNEKKSKNYWPDVGKSVQYGNVIIECNMCEKYMFYTYRKFSLKCKNKIRKIDQLHLSLPPNDSRYLSSLNYVHFFQKMSKIPHNPTSPILVHSSAGMSGISFALLCDMSLRSARKDGVIDVMASFKRLVQTTSEMKIEFDHYVAAHAIIADTLNHMDTSIACNAFDASKPEIFTKEEIQKQLQYMEDTLWLDGINIMEEKDFYVNCPTVRPIPESEQRDVECEMPLVDRSQFQQSDFLQVSGFTASGKFWVATRPISTPLSDFLQKVQEKNISVIVALNDNIFTWPSEDHPEMVISNDLTLNYKFIKKLRSYDWITLELKTNTTTQMIDVVTFQKWSAPVVSFPNIADFVNLVMESNEIFQNSESVLITCHDGVTSSGLYLATTYIIQKIKAESVCDVCTCIRILRRHCQDFVKDEKQYIFLLEAAYNYMQQFTLYETN